MAFSYCPQCGARQTGWTPVPRFGRWVCPACAQGVRREPVADTLEKRRALRERVIRQLQGEEESHVAAENLRAFLREVESGIEALERRESEANDEIRDTGRGDGGAGAETGV